MDPPDQEDTDQQPDFRLLLTNSKGASQALPSRDAKTAQDPAAALEEQYNAFFKVLAEERHAAERTFSRATFEPDLGLFRLTLNRGTHFVSMGHTLSGQIYLYPEEALYLVDRGSLLVDHQGVNMSVQQVWSIYLTCGRTQKTRELAMERYLAYSYLKRLGFIVIRPGTYGYEDVSGKLSSATTREHALTRPATTVSTQWLQIVWRTFTDTWRRCLVAVADTWTGRFAQPLVSINARMSYDQVLQKLQIIPSERLAPGLKHGTDHPGKVKKTMVDFEVYKPAGAFKKRQPGVPDYQVVVVESTTMLPNLNKISALMEGQHDPAQDNTVPGIAGLDGGKTKKSTHWPQILFAVVNGGQVSFMNMLNIKVSMVHHSFI